MKNNMEKEIYSEVDTITRIKESYVKSGKVNFNFPDVQFDEIKFIASGSSYNAARLGQKFFETYTDKLSSFEYASEFISNPNKKIKKDILYCFVSQSGETYDTKCALEIIQKNGGKTISFVNNSNSTIYNGTNFGVDVLAGCENSIAATKSFLACVICLWLFAVSFSVEKINIEEHLTEAKNAIDDILKNSFSIDYVAKVLSKKNKLSIVGYNFGYILAKELALKIKETSYIDTSAYPTGEFLHGHTAILNSNKTLVEIFTSSYLEFEQKTLAKIKKDFNPEIIEITDKKRAYKKAVYFKNYQYEISKICAIIIILQLLALKIALLKKMDVDKPNGLNKVVAG